MRRQDDNKGQKQAATKKTTTRRASTRKATTKGAAAKKAAAKKAATKKAAPAPKVAVPKVTVPKKKVAVVKYNAGNIFSIINMLHLLGVEPVLTDDPEVIKAADKVVLPGQGEAGSVMYSLRLHRLVTVIRQLKQPVLGICIGQQLLCSHSEEGNTDCIGVFDAPVLLLHPRRHHEKVPAVGWGVLHNMRGPLFKGVPVGSHVYFVHSYYVPLCAETVAEADYIEHYSAAMQKGNFFATQFHPEKSGKVGEIILKNFIEL